MINILPFSNLLLLPNQEKNKFLNKRTYLLGQFTTFSDDLILQILSFLTAKELLELLTINSFFYTFATHDPLYKSLYLEDSTRKQFEYKGNWRSLYCKVQGKTFHSTQEIPTRTYYSDALYKHKLYAFSSVVEKITSLKSKFNLNSVSSKQLSLDEFISSYESSPSRPVNIIQDDLKHTWSAFSKISSLGLKSISTNLDNSTVRCGPLNIELKEFEKYCQYFNENENAEEENQLYLFDCAFLESDEEFKPDRLYSPQVYFAAGQERDLFRCMGETRPDYRWVIAGPAGSGSKWHIDPNFTHAWNTVVSGSKFWILLPFNCVPVGVYPSEDLVDLTQPISLNEWFALYFDVTLQKYGSKLHMGIAKEGETLFVPARFWHCVVNLEHTVAITQNYISKTNLRRCLLMMKKQPELVSGIPCGRDKSTVYKEFVQSLLVAGAKGMVSKEIIELIHRVEQGPKANENSGMASLFSGGTCSKRAKIEDNAGQTFSFNFCAV
eukprot:snap_masked-scaffold_15-processed-gene-6.26-mRNA-1 protein AED:0.08 eAED:0.09 QI:0/-1/0/1/-1/1/1/0/494